MADAHHLEQSVELTAWSARKATMTISGSDRAKAWVEEQVRAGLYETTSDYVHDLMSRDQGRRAEELTLDELCQKLATSKASGVATRTVDQIFAEAVSIARARGHLNE